jgi:aspartate aminotransferase
LHAASNISSITQKAAVAALSGPQHEVARMRATYRARRDQVHAWLTAHPGIRCLRPQGAFYLFPDISALLSPDGVATSAAFAERLLDEHQVAVTPGEGFGAPGYIRISYATSLDTLKRGAERILAFAEALTRATKLTKTV